MPSSCLQLVVYTNRDFTILPLERRQQSTFFKARSHEISLCFRLKLRAFVSKRIPRGRKLNNTIMNVKFAWKTLKICCFCLLEALQNFYQVRLDENAHEKFIKSSKVCVEIWSEEVECRECFVVGNKTLFRIAFFMSFKENVKLENCVKVFSSFLKIFMNNLKLLNLFTEIDWKWNKTWQWNKIESGSFSKVSVNWL